MPIYLIISNYHKIVKKEIAKIIQNNTDKETIYFDLNKNSILEVIAEAGYNSLFNDEKNIVVYNANIFTTTGKLNDNEAEELTNYFNNPNPVVNLIFVCTEKEDSRKKIVKLLKEKNHILNYLKISYKDLIILIKDYLKEINYNLSDEVINYLIKVNNQKYEVICNEIDKLQLCFEKEVDLNLAKNLISTSINDNVFKFVDEVVAKNHQSAALLLTGLKIMKTEPTVVMSLIAREYRLMLHYKVSLNSNDNPRDVLMKDGLHDWQIAKVTDNAKQYQLEELKRIMKLLADYDYKYKSGQVDRAIVLELLIMEIIN